MGWPAVWIEPGASQQYYPLVHSIFWVEHRFWVTDIGLIISSTFSCTPVARLLLVKILRRMECREHWLAAAIFALHPVEVESVAWISELKEHAPGVLFVFGAALVYFKFRPGSKGTFMRSAGSFRSRLMAKTVIATLQRLCWCFLVEARGVVVEEGRAAAAGHFLSWGCFRLFTAWMERNSWAPKVRSLISPLSNGV